MTEKKDFKIKVKTGDGGKLTFVGKGCKVKKKSFFTKLGITREVTQELECDDVELEELPKGLKKEVEDKEMELQIEGVITKLQEIKINKKNKSKKK